MLYDDALQHNHLSVELEIDRIEQSYVERAMLSSLNLALICRSCVFRANIRYAQMWHWLCNTDYELLIPRNFQ